jgi:hypothetical protein
MGQPRPLKRYFLYFAIVFICLGTAYWLKSAMGVNLSRDTSLAAYFPFSLFRFEQHIYEEYGPVDVVEDFDSFFFYKMRWQKVHTPEKDAISVERSRTGPGSSPSLRVTNMGQHWWHVSHRYFYAVREHDRFHLEGMLLNSGEQGYGEIQVSALDAERRILQRDRWRLGTNTRGKQVHVEKLFAIPADVAYIRLRVAGEGPGRFEYDNLRLVRLAPAEPPQPAKTGH